MDRYMGVKLRSNPLATHSVPSCLRQGPAGLGLGTFHAGMILPKILPMKIQILYQMPYPCMAQYGPHSSHTSRGCMMLPKDTSPGVNPLTCQTQPIQLVQV